MESKKSDTNDVEQLKDLMECCICAKKFSDPRLLPCSHTFCLKCLKNAGERLNLQPGNAMACPLCTMEFSIPSDGFSGLQRNYFVDKLMQISGVIGRLSSGIQCDVCLEERNLKSEKATPDADYYCEDCEQNLCPECFKQHNRFRGTKLHKVIDVEEHTKTKVLSEKPVQTFCLLHGRVKLKIFCFDCKRIICAVCFIETHQTHTGSEVSKVAEDYRKKIKEMVIELGQKERAVDGKSVEVNKSKCEVLQVLETLEKDVMQHYEKIKETGEKQLKLLLLELENMRQTKLKEVSDMKEELEKHAGNLAKHRNYCNDIVAVGSETDVCQDMSGLSGKNTELGAQHDEILKLQVRPVETVFKKSSLIEILGSGDSNMIGSLSEIVLDSLDATTNGKYEIEIESREEVTSKPYGELICARSDAEIHEEDETEESEELTSESDEELDLERPAAETDNEFAFDKQCVDFVECIGLPVHHEDVTMRSYGELDLERPAAETDKEFAFDKQCVDFVECIPVHHEDVTMRSYGVALESSVTEADDKFESVIISCKEDIIKPYEIVLESTDANIQEEYQTLRCIAKSDTKIEYM